MVRKKGKTFDKLPSNEHLEEIRHEIMQGSFWVKPVGEKFDRVDILSIIGENVHGNCTE